MEKVLNKQLNSSVYFRTLIYITTFILLLTILNISYSSFSIKTYTLNYISISSTRSKTNFSDDGVHRPSTSQHEFSPGINNSTNGSTKHKNNPKEQRDLFSRKDIQRKEKRILLWTRFYTLDGEDAHCIGKKGLKRQKQMCGYQCEFTANRSLINSSHAVVFHGRDLNTKTEDTIRYLPTDIPTERDLSQYWIFFMLESPSNTWNDLSPFQNIFNWTMSYRTDSDIFIPYGKVDIVKEPNQLGYPHPGIANKTKLVAWINSNYAFQPSQRNELVTELKKYINVDIYGKCGNLKCSKNNTNFCEDLLSCYEEIGKDYKFYLAFENSLCEDYVTEKAFNALRTGMVPVLYGHVSYSRYLPNNSYINVMDFSSTETLAKYLIHLDQTPEEYLQYFEWRRSHKVVEDDVYLERAWCSLCERVSRRSQSDSLQVTAVSDLNTWWNFRNGSDVCISPPSKFKL